MRDALDEFYEYDRAMNDTSGVPICEVCEEPIWDAKYLEYDQKCCHCDDDCAFDFFKDYIKRDLTYTN